MLQAIFSPRQHLSGLKRQTADNEKCLRTDKRQAVNHSYSLVSTDMLGDWGQRKKKDVVH